MKQLSLTTTELAYRTCITDQTKKLWLEEVGKQRKWSINKWCGIVGEHITVPHFLYSHPNRLKYATPLRDMLPVLLEEVSNDVRSIIWHQHDRCSAREALCAFYPEYWIERNGPVSWPPRSPDFTSPDYFPQGHLKDTELHPVHQRICDIALPQHVDQYQNIRTCISDYRWGWDW
jgi:hypothetical protein